MKLTSAQRRERLRELLEKDPEYMRMQAICDAAKTRFDRFTAFLPARLRSRLREYPGMMFFMHSRMIETVCRQMRFPDED